MADRNTVLQYSFATGVVAPGVRNRKDWERIDAAIAAGLNGTVTPSGGFCKRPGFRYVNECLHHNLPIRKVTFRFSHDQVYELEFGEYLMRFYRDGELILMDDKVTPYVLETPFSAQEAQEFTASQERDALFFAHWDKPLKQLTRYDHNRWVWSDVFEQLDEKGNPVERIASPDRVEWYDNASDGHNGYEYAVTAYKMVDGTPQESINYSTIFSDPDTVDFIGETPTDSILSCAQWNATYKPTHGNVEGFPKFPDVFDLRNINEDASPVGGSVLHPKIFGVWKLKYPSAVRGARRAYFSQTSTTARTRMAWSIYGPGQSGTNYLWNVYYGQNSNYGIKPENFRIYSDYQHLAAAYDYTWIMYDQAFRWVEGDAVSVDGQTKTSIYNAMTAFVESYNEAHTQRISNHIKWPSVEGADGYYVYRRLKGGTSGKFWLVDDVAPTVLDWLDEDVTETPIRDKNPISGVNDFTEPGKYPNLVTFYQQRMVLGCTKEKPTTIFGSRTGIYRDYSIDASDNSSGYEFKMASNTSDPLVAVLPLYTLAILTNGGDFISTVTGAMNASNVNFNQKSYNGASGVRPLILGDSGIYVPLSGKGLNSMAYSYDKDGFRHDNLLFNAQHYLSGKRIIDLAFQRDPINLIWALLDDGTLLSCLYIPEQSFVAWSQHRTDGVVKSINMVPTSSGLDVLSVVVERTLGDGSKRQYIEYLEGMLPYSEEPDGENSFYVDSGLSGFFGHEVQTITGLQHLEGREVAILADNSVVPPRVVRNGSITLDVPAKTVHIGLPYVYQLETLRFDLVDQTLRDTRAQINTAIVEVLDTRDLEWSANGGPWEDLIVHMADNMGEPALVNGDIELEMVSRTHARGAYLAFRSTRPLPCNLNSLVAQITKGDH